jgi:hypothetical protein
MRTDTAKVFVGDLTSCIAGRVQITTDGYREYIDAIDDEFGIDVDYAILEKTYAAPTDGQGAIARRRALARRVRRWLGVPMRTIFPHPMLSVGTSPCAWACGG